MNSILKLLKFWSPVALWALFIYKMSSPDLSASNTWQIFEPLVRFFAPNISVERLEMLHFATRKVGHFLEYFILGFLLFWAIRGGAAQRLRPRWFILAFLFTSLYAVSDEWHQMWVADRSASPYDVLLDSFGALTAQLLLFWRWCRRSA